MTILVAGGAGELGVAFVIRWLEEVGERVVNLNALEDFRNIAILSPLAGDARHVTVLVDTDDARVIDAVMSERRPRALVAFSGAACSGRSRRGAALLLEAAQRYHGTLDEAARQGFRFAYVYANGGDALEVTMFFPIPHGPYDLPAQEVPGMLIDALGDMRQAG